eukprot:Rhum_TRINITY_DN14237_c21_g1::Rhum_TRINITY_DN14237_c21_g1_i1::g.75435::m.75435
MRTAAVFFSCYEEDSVTVDEDESDEVEYTEFEEAERVVDDDEDKDEGEGEEVNAGDNNGVSRPSALSSPSSPSPSPSPPYSSSSSSVSGDESGDASADAAATGAAAHPSSAVSQSLRVLLVPGCTGSPMFLSTQWCDGQCFFDFGNGCVARMPCTFGSRTSSVFCGRYTGCGGGGGGASALLR